MNPATPPSDGDVLEYVVFRNGQEVSRRQTIALGTDAASGPARVGAGAPQGPEAGGSFCVVNRAGYLVNAQVWDGKSAQRRTYACADKEAVFALARHIQFTQAAIPAPPGETNPWERAGPPERWSRDPETLLPVLGHTGQAGYESRGLFTIAAPLHIYSTQRGATP